MTTDPLFFLVAKIIETYNNKRDAEPTASGKVIVGSIVIGEGCKAIRELFDVYFEERSENERVERSFEE